MGGFKVKRKETNTFRFKTFADRVAEIDIRQSALYRIGHENEELDEDEDATIFAQTLRKWSVLNLSPEYSEFMKKCRGIVTLPQLLHKKDFLAEVLTDAIQTCTTLSLEAILDALVAFAKDIREEFYPYFEEFLEKLIKLLHKQDPDQVEWTIRCLAYLFKYLRPYLKRNISVVLTKIVPLLDEENNPEYIVQFASECFAYTARDVKDFEKFMKISIKSFVNQRTGLSGCGKLFFELVRGVSGNFHSVARDFLTNLFGCFANPKFDPNVLLEIVMRTVSEIMENINLHNLDLYWEIIIQQVNRMLGSIEVVPSGSLLCVLKIMRQSVELKRGKGVKNVSEVVSLLVRLFECVEDEEILDEGANIATNILQADCINLQQMDASRLICKTLSIGSSKIFETFVWNICAHPQFDALVMPSFLNYFETKRNEKTLDLLVRVIEKRSGRSTDSGWKKHPVKLRKPETIMWLEGNVKTFNINKFERNDLELYLLSTMLLPHLAIVNSSTVEILKEKLENIVHRSEIGDTSMTTALVTVESLLIIDPKIESEYLLSIINTLIGNRPVTPIVLNILVAIFDHAQHFGKSIFTKEMFLKLQQKISDNLLIGSVEIRILTAKILNSFKILPELQPIYEVFYNATKIQPNVGNYRELLVLVQKLSPSGQLYKSTKMETIKLDILKFLLGLWHHNFKLLWDPVAKVVEELVESLPLDDFWQVYRRKLEEVNASIKGKSTASKEKAEVDKFESQSLVSLRKRVCPDDDSVDWINYRNLLWKSMSNFPKITGVKNKEIVGFFLDFVATEYKNQDERSADKWNVLSDECNDLDNDDDEDSFIRSRGKANKGQSFALQTMCVMLEVFAKMENPKQLFKEPEIRSVYHEMLMGTNERLQKLSLDCLMRYKMKACIQYKDHLYALIDDKKFKDELVNFKLGVESNMVDPDHRPELMPILLRILFGKMRSKTSNKFISSQMRRSIVMRFLAGCKTDEIFWFMQMAFQQYGDLLKGSLESIPRQVKTNLELSAVPSPKKLRSALNLLELLRKQFGGLMEKDFLIYMLKMITLAGAVCAGVFENSQNVNEKYLAVFRNLRSQCTTCLVNFFDHFQEFDLEHQQLRACLDIFVWPGLLKLPSDCLHTPTPLMKLFITWSRNPNYFRYLAEKDSDGNSPLRVVVSLLGNDKPSAAIRRTIIEMAESILQMEESESRDAKKKPDSILAPYVEQILQRLTKSLSSKSLRKGFGKTELFLLSKITEMKLDVSVSDTLLKVVLQIANGKARVVMPEERTAQLVSTLRNLMIKIEDPEKHIRNVLPLFEKITSIGTRKDLCQIFFELRKKSKHNAEKLGELAEFTAKLNAWDRKWIEQPDYDKRLSALRAIREKTDNGEISMELGLLAIYNCFYFLHHDKDIGLRDNACMTLRSLVPKLVTKHMHDTREVNYLVEDVMFSLVRRTLRDKNDVLRNEGIILLGEMVRDCPNAHPVLNDLKALSCKQDLEVDFFENVTHLQLHRHGRALLKFCTYAKECESAITTRTLTQFLLPLTTRYLLSEKYAAKHTLVDAAIDAIGMICRFLPWHQYHTILKYYLQKMRHCREYHKQCIRIIISILDAFHFDLSNANEITASESGLASSSASTLVDDDTMEDGTEEPADDDLDSELDEMEIDDAELSEVPAKRAKLPAYLDNPVRLPPSAAKNVIRTITSSMIPSLNHSITELSTYESKHKLNRRRVNFEREEEESLRVPIALAITKLLKKLPKETLDRSINGVFLKVCTFLKSPVKSVRMLARDILKKIMITIGPEYLPLLLSQMVMLLTKGFQVHVLSVTLFSVLDCLKSDLKTDQAEKALQYILNVALNDIFGDASDEKEVEKIGAATPEAKPSAKSYLSLQIAANNIPANCILDLMIPFKHYIFKTQSKKVLMKIQECFQKIISGLAENANISPEELLEFVYGLVSESIPDLSIVTRKLTETEKQLLVRSHSDCLLIAQEPKSRSGAVRTVAKTNVNANAYILIESGLELLHIILRRKKFNRSEYLESIVPLLTKCLESTHVRVCTLSLKCLISIWTLELDIAALKEDMDSIVTQIFAILHKYFNFGVARKDDNFQLVKNAMKAVGCIIRSCDYYTVCNEHVVQLLFYIGQDVGEADRQPVAFSLLKSLIDKDIFSKEMHDIMQKLCQIAITSQSDYSRDESRAVLLSYVSKFYREKKVESINKFFIAQLNYEVLAGRISAVKFLDTLAKRYPVDVLDKKAEVMFLGLGTRMVNEEVPECRMLIAQCLEKIISRLNSVTRQKLFDISVLFFDSDKSAVREMAACLCSRFVEAEKDKFLPRAISLLPLLEMYLGLNSPKLAGRFVRVNTSNGDDETGDPDNLTAKQRAQDHAIIQIQNCILKIFTYCPQILMDTAVNSTIDGLAYESQKLLGYDHDWVRLNAVKILNSVLAAYDTSKSPGMRDEAGLSDEGGTRQFINEDPENDLRSLTLDLCAQLTPGDSNEELASEISKSLLLIANILKSIQASNRGDSLKINLKWLLRRVLYVIYGEVAKAPKIVILREALFDWIEGLMTLLNANELIDICPSIIGALIRETSEDDANINAQTRQKAVKIMNKIRKKIGDENYDKIRLAAQTRLMLKRANRKKELAQEKILDPVRSAKRKASTRERKKEAKKRKTDLMRGKHGGMKKKKRKNLDEIF